MSQATRNLLGEAADIRSRCDVLLDHLKWLEDLVSSDETPTARQDEIINDANWRWGASTRDYVDRATDAVDEWRRQVKDASRTT